MAVRHRPPPLHVDLRGRVRLEGLDQIVIRRFLRDESGATVVEYAMLIAIFSIGLVGIMSALGTSLRQKFVTIATTLTGL